MEVSWTEVREAIKDAIEEAMGAPKVELAPKWNGGKIILEPFDPDQQGKEIPVAVFFKKITSVRERLRVLEQKINNHPALSDTDKAEFQQLITRAYGSLTTFNLLFRDKQDHFVGMKGE